MHRVDTIPAFDFANERRGDVFSHRIPESVGCRGRPPSGRAGSATPERRSIGRRALAKGLAAVSLSGHGGASSR